MEGNFLKGAIAIVLSTIIVVNVLIPTYKGANQTGWTSSETSAFSLLSLITIFGLVYGVGSVFGLL